MHDMFFAVFLGFLATLTSVHCTGDQPLSKIRIQNTILAVHDNATISVNPALLGLNGEDTEWVTVDITSAKPSGDDWVGVFSPAKLDSSSCQNGNEPKDQKPFICTAPIKYKFANEFKDYVNTGHGSLSFQIINQRADFSFGLFSGGLNNPKLVAVSNFVSFANPKAPLYPRLAQGKSWDEMTVTWNSGYDISEAYPLVEYSKDGHMNFLEPAGTITYTQNMLCGAPARTIGWRDPGFIHTSHLKNLWPNSLYTYRVGHQFPNNTFIWSSKNFTFKSSPYPGQNSLQRVIIFGDMGKGERDGSNEYSDYQPAALNTTDQLIKDLDNIDIVFHIGDITYANGYLSQWDQFTAQVEPIAATKAYMIASGNHERDWPNTGSFYDGMDSGGECGVPNESMFYFPAENTAKFWYQTDYGMFRFCIADSEHDWRIGTEQYKFIEQCLSSVDRKKQPWLIFAAHRPLAYSSGSYYGQEGSYEEPTGRAHLEALWQKYKVDLAFYGHVHNYERTCPVYQTKCMTGEKSHFSGTYVAPIHVVVGGGGSHLTPFSQLIPRWSVYRDFDFGFVKMTSFNNSYLLYEYKRSSDGKVYDTFTISRDYRDVLACATDSCSPVTMAN